MIDRSSGHGMAVLLLAPLLLAGCNDTRRDWSSCQRESCDHGYVCTFDKRCVLAPDSGVLDSGVADSAVRLDGAIPPLIDAAMDSPAPAVDLMRAGDTATPSPDEAADVPMIDSEPGRGVDAASPGLIDAAVDGGTLVPVPDTRPQCVVDKDCTSPTAAHCWQGRCVACTTSTSCGGATPICSDMHSCVSCAAADAGCPAELPACDPTSGRCVECTSDSQCTVGSKPICDSQAKACVRCSSDAQCARSGPGVCMAHLDGRCASDAETVYVGSTGTATCSDVDANAGSARAPYCSVQKGVLAARTKSRPLVVLAGALVGGFSGITFTTPLTVVGKDAAITPADAADGISLASGELYLRGLKVTGKTGGRLGISAQAASGATVMLHMEDCAVTDNPGGGILLDGASFDIRNTVVANNGAGQTSTGVVFGGIRVDNLVAGGQATLAQVTITGNAAVGLSCSGRIDGAGVLASGNDPLDVADSCGVKPCLSPAVDCGAQP